MPRTTFVRIVAATAIATAALAVTAACGSTSSSTPSSSTSAATVVNGNNAQDKTFLTEMVAHHEQAIDMAEMVPSHTKNAQVRALAAKIEAAQTPEILKMEAWLHEWNEGQPSTSAAAPGAGHDMSGMDHAGPTGAPTPMGPGMMTAEQMAQLEAKSGAAFDQMWLTMMIAHHEGAITMSQQELAQGENAQVKAVAQAIIDGQAKEVAEMKAMLKQ